MLSVTKCEYVHCLFLMKLQLLRAITDSSSSFYGIYVTKLCMCIELCILSTFIHMFLVVHQKFNSQIR